MRIFLSLAFCALLGCGSTATPDLQAAAETDALPTDLGTRSVGIDWPCFQGPTGASVSPEKGILAPWPKNGPPIVWEMKTGEGYAMPSISRGRAFFFDRIRNRQRLRALKSETGESLWTFEYNTDYTDMYSYSGGPRCCPIVDGGRVYILGPEGMLHCLKAADGTVIWKVDTNAEFNVVQNFFGVGSAPVIEGDLLICQIGGSPKNSDKTDFLGLKGDGSSIVAFDKHTGKVKYKAGDELASYASPMLTTIEGRRWGFVFARSGLVGFDPTNGKIDFQYPWRARIIESVNAANPVIVGNRVLISETYGPGSALVEVKAATPAKEIWTDLEKPRNKSMQAHWATPIHVDGYVYGCSGRHTNNAELRCIELATGKVMWSQAGWTRTTLLLIDDHFLCLGEDGVLRLLKVNPKKCEEISQVELQGKDSAPLLQYPCWAAPLVSHGLLYVRGKDHVVCLDLIPSKK